MKESTNEAALFVGSLIESEYINTQHVYFTYCFIGMDSIMFSRCRQEGLCKHRAALFALLIIQSSHSKVAPKDFHHSA